MSRGRLARRLRTLEAEACDDWRLGRGISSLLEYARKHPRPPLELWELDPNDTTGLAQLLREHWARRERQDEGRKEDGYG